MVKILCFTENHLPLYLYPNLGQLKLKNHRHTHSCSTVLEFSNDTAIQTNRQMNKMWFVSTGSVQ